MSGIAETPAVPTAPAVPAQASSVMPTVYGLAITASVAASAFHGYRRNNSIFWALAWAAIGGFAPVITPAVALAQGFGKPIAPPVPAPRDAQSDVLSTLQALPRQP